VPRNTNDIGRRQHFIRTNLISKVIVLKLHGSLYGHISCCSPEPRFRKEAQLTQRQATAAAGPSGSSNQSQSAIPHTPASKPLSPSCGESSPHSFPRSAFVIACEED